MVVLIIIGIIVVLFIGLKIYQNKISKSYKLQIFFCPPGGGKTTLASWYAKRAQKLGQNVWSNVDIKGCYKIDKSDLGKYDLYDGTVIIDEAGVEFDNRKFKEFTDNQTYFFKYHRHYKLNVLVFSQSYADMDLKIRNLASNLFLVGKSWIPFFIFYKEIGRNIGISEDKQVIDEFFFVPLSCKRIFAPKVWNMFNTYSRKVLESKEFETW